MRRIAAPAVLVGALIALAWSARPRTLEVAATFDAALRLAASEARWIVAHVRRADRPLGVRMDRQLERSGELARAPFTELVHVRIDAALEPELAERLAGAGAALVTVIADERGDPVARHAGYASPDELVELLERTNARRSAIERARARLDDDASDADARLDLARELFALGVPARAEAEVERVLGTVDVSADARSRGFALKAELLAARGQESAAAAIRRELGGEPAAGPTERSAPKPHGAEQCQAACAADPALERLVPPIPEE